MPEDSADGDSSSDPRPGDGPAATPEGPGAGAPGAASAPGGDLDGTPEGGPATGDPLTAAVPAIEGEAGGGSAGEGATSVPATGGPAAPEGDVLLGAGAAAAIDAEAGEGSGGSARQRRKKARHGAHAARRRRWPRRVLIGVLALVVLLAAGVGGVWWYVGYRFGQIKVVQVHHLTKAKPGEPFNILLVGSDSRAFATTPSQCQAFGCGASQGGQRSDVIIIARVVPATHQITMLSIPRDTWVNIPGNEQYVSGQNRINVAFNDGPSLLVQTIEQDFNIPINYFVEVNFPGLSSMVQDIGGIYLDFPYQVRDLNTGLGISKTGCQLINGVQALALVRSRHLQYLQNGVWQDDLGSDFSRIHNQQAFFRAVIKRLHSQVDPTNIFSLNHFIGDAVHNFVIDQTFSKGLMISLANEFHSFPPNALKTETLPTVGPVFTSGGAEVLLPAAAADDYVITAFNAIGLPKSSSSTTTTIVSSTTSSSTTSTTTTAPGATTVTTVVPPSTTVGTTPTVTTVQPTPSNEAPILNNTIEPWTPRPC